MLLCSKTLGFVIDYIAVIKVNRYMV